MTLRFADKRVLVTGGASGLGWAIAEAFAEEGAVVVIADLPSARAEETARAMSAQFVACDVSDAAAVEAVFADGDCPDIVVNNAGIFSEKVPLHEISVGNWQAVMRVNLDGAFYVLKFAIPRMIQRGGGVIVNMLSVAAISGVLDNAPYSAAKSGLARLTREAAVTYGPNNIRVNGVAPTAVMTEAMEARIAAEPDPQAFRAMLESLNPLPGMPHARDVAHAVCFLASDEARYISGAVLPVDGAYSAR